MSIPLIDDIKRRVILEKAHRNVQIIPSEMVEYDFLTDSLQHQRPTFPRKDKRARHLSSILPKSAFLEFQAAVKEVFGFPYSIPVSQGRFAESILSRLLVSPGKVIPTNIPFATTRIHQEFNGGRSIEVMPEGAYDLNNPDPFKANVDEKIFEAVIQKYTPRWVAYTSVELCANGLGGQAIHIDNLAKTYRISREYGIPMFLDACRILDQAVLIKQQVPRYRQTRFSDIVKEICTCCDGLTLSLSKNFATDIGGLIAFNDENLYHQAFDFIMAMGDGLSLGQKANLAEALREGTRDSRLVEQRIRNARALHANLKSAGFPVAEPAGAHAVLIDLNRLLDHIAPEDFPAEALNHDWYERFGLRGSPHALSSRQKKLGQSLFRLAVPLFKYDNKDIEKISVKLKNWFRQRGRVKPLVKTHVPPGFSGEFRAHYQLKK